ncbi:MAG: UvrD-helicase domain-containing protein, partial [Pseudomonadota bacterium]
MNKNFFNNALTKLNPRQKEAVNTIDGPVLVLAGPGTGKTQVLTLRIGSILEKTQMNPQNILCLTFTESAAHEMKERLVKFIGTPAYDVK